MLETLPTRLAAGWTVALAMHAVNRSLDNRSHVCIGCAHAVSNFNPEGDKMQLYSKTLLTTDLDAIARAMGIECVHGSFLGERRRRVSFTLRPAGRDGWRMARDRRVNAVSWAGHYVFMRALFARDAHAEIRSSVARYVGASDFAETAFDTGNVNVGSQMSPLRYRDAEADGHVQWSTEADLVRIGDLLGAAAR